MRVSRSQFVTALLALGATLTPKATRASQPPWYPLPPPLPLGKGRALVVSGAGARGSYEAGALKWLFRNVQSSGQPFDVICGTSAGAINAAFAAQGTPQSIEQTELLWKGMPDADVLKLVPQAQDLANAAEELKGSSRHGYPAKLNYFFRAKRDIQAAGPPADLVKIMGVVDDSGIQGLVKKYPLDLNALQTSVVLTATNVTTLTADSFYKFVGSDAQTRAEQFISRATPSGRLPSLNGAPPLRQNVSTHHSLTPENFVDAVLASAAVPGVFQPVAVKRAESDDVDLYVDGGVANNTPVGLAVTAGATDVTVIMVDAPDEMPAPPKTILELLLATQSVSSHRILESDVTIAIAKNLLASRGDWTGLNATTTEYLEALHQRDWKPITLRLIRPRAALEVTMMGFNDQKGIDAAFDLGYADAQQEWVYTIG